MDQDCSPGSLAPELESEPWCCRGSLASLLKCSPWQQTHREKGAVHPLDNSIHTTTNNPVTVSGLVGLISTYVYIRYPGIKEQDPTNKRHKISLVASGKQSNLNAQF